MSGLSTTTFLLLLHATMSWANPAPTPASRSIKGRPSIPAKHDPNNPYKYIASDTLATIGLVVYLAIAIAQLVWFIRLRGRYMLPMTIGAFFFSAGVAIRYDLHNNPDETGIFIAQYILILLSPCAFIAAVYSLLGNMAQRLHVDSLLLVPAGRIAKLFITSDVVTFLIQAGGGSLSTSAKHQKLGSDIVLVGLIIQVISFSLFTLVYLVFLLRVKTREPQVWNLDAHQPFGRGWRTLALMVAISCGGILIRTIYRLIEFAQGFTGHLATTEIFFWCFDALPLAIAIGVYVPFWPERMLPRPDSAIPMRNMDGSGTAFVAKP